MRREALYGIGVIVGVGMAVAVAVGGNGVAVGGIVVGTAVAGTDGEPANGTDAVDARVTDVGATAVETEVATVGEIPPDVAICGAAGAAGGLATNADSLPTRVGDAAHAATTEDAPASNAPMTVRRVRRGDDRKREAGR